MNKTNANALKRVILIFVAVTAIFFGWAALDFVQEVIFLHSAEQAMGTVTDIGASTSYQDQQYLTDYCPVIDFQTKAGRAVKYDSQVCSNKPEYKLGQQVMIYYDPRNPTNSQMQNWIDEYSSVVGPIIIGLISAFIGGLVFLASMQKEKEALRDKASYGY